MAKRTKRPKVTVPRTNTFASEASTSALLRFAPQLRALTQLQQDAQTTYKTGVAQARGNADASIATIGQAGRDVGSYYDQAGLAQAKTASLVQSNIASLPNLDPNIRAAIGLEQASGANAVTTGKAQALTGLATQKVAARSGAQFASNKAYQDLVDTLTKIGTQRQGILADQGTFTATEAARLQREDTANQIRTATTNAQLSQSERNSIRSAGLDPDQPLPGGGYAPIPGGKADPKAKPKKHDRSATGAKLHTTGEHETAKNLIATGMSTLAGEDPDRSARHDYAPALVAGAKEQPGAKAVPLRDTKSGKPVINKDGTPKVTYQWPDGSPATAADVAPLPAIPKIGWLATVAADVYYDGHVSRANQLRLSKAGYSLKQLGLPTYAQWKKAGGKRPPSYAQGTTAGYPAVQALVGGLSRLGR